MDEDNTGHTGSTIYEICSSRDTYMYNMLGTYVQESIEVITKTVGGENEERRFLDEICFIPICHTFFNKNKWVPC